MKPECNEIKKEIADERSLEIAETLYAVTILEYHDSNWLSGHSKNRNEMKQELLRELVCRLAK